MIMPVKGFTLPECLAVVGILAILNTIAWPALKSLIELQFNHSLQSALLSSITKARSNAITARTSVELCPSTDQQTCNLTWDKGWYIRSKQSVISTHYITQPVRLNWSGFSKNPTFIADGSTPTSNGKFYLCHQEKIAWQIILNRQGRTRLATLTENRAADHLCN